MKRSFLGFHGSGEFWQPFFWQERWAMPFLLEMSSAATTALDDAWQWVAQRSVSADSLNEHGDRFSEFSSRQLNEQCSAAVCAVGLAMYYVAWHAYREELEAGTMVDAE